MTDERALGPTPERLAKGQQIVPALTEQAGVFAARVNGENLLDRMVIAWKREIADLVRRAEDMQDAAARRHDAGMHLRYLALRASIMPKTTGGMAMRGGGEMSDKVARAKAEYTRLLREVGPGFAGILESVCVYDEKPPGIPDSGVNFALDQLWHKCRDKIEREGD